MPGEFIDPVAPILWLLRGAPNLAMIPFVKMVVSAGALGATVGTAMGEYSAASRAAGGTTVGTGADWYSPEIQKYEATSFGSTRII